MKQHHELTNFKSIDSKSPQSSLNAKKSSIISSGQRGTHSSKIMPASHTQATRTKMFSSASASGLVPKLNKPHMPSTTAAGRNDPSSNKKMTKTKATSQNNLMNPASQSAAVNVAPPSKKSKPSIQSVRSTSCKSTRSNHSSKKQI